MTSTYVHGESNWKFIFLHPRPSSTRKYNTNTCMQQDNYTVLIFTTVRNYPSKVIEKNSHSFPMLSDLSKPPCKEDFESNHQLSK
jgi:hypothetical protein